MVKSIDFKTLRKSRVHPSPSSAVQGVPPVLPKTILNECPPVALIYIHVYIQILTGYKMTNWLALWFPAHQLENLTKWTMHLAITGHELDALHVVLILWHGGSLRPNFCLKSQCEYTLNLVRLMVYA